MATGSMFIIQNTMPQKEDLAINLTVYVIFSWQVERVLDMKFPGEASRAQEAGHVNIAVHMKCVQLAQNSLANLFWKIYLDYLYLCRAT